MRVPPSSIATADVIHALAAGWGFEAQALVFAPVGNGSHHWIATDPRGQRRFVTVDELDRKPWLGETRTEVLGGLSRSFRTALTLRASGLGFVVAPIPTATGQPLLALGEQHTVALFPFVDGRAGDSMEFSSADERANLVKMLAALHGATELVRSVAPRRALTIPGRAVLEAALRDVGHPWSGRPSSEPVRAALARHGEAVSVVLARHDQLAGHVARGADWVVTHGEPHGRNVLRTDGGLLLVDWDTVAVAPPERDLWLVIRDPREAEGYTAITGHVVDVAALRYFRLAWDLADLAVDVALLRSAHDDTADTRKALENVEQVLHRIGGDSTAH